MVKQDVVLSKIITREALENAIRVNAGIGGSTNAVIHLIALARRLGIDLDLDDWDSQGRGVPCLLNIMPSGEFLMEDFFEAGGLPAILRQLGERDLLHKSALTVNGQTIWENNQDAPCWNREVIHEFDSPFKATWRDRRAEGKSRAGWSGLEAIRGIACVDETYRPRSGLRVDRRSS